jgi:curli production assembly/transport component CsgF
MKRNVTFILIALLLGIVQFAQSQDLKYKAINPAFGGDTFNYQWLLNSAQEQNDFKEESDINSLLNQDPVKQFQDDLNRQILSQLSNKLVSEMFGEQGLKEGSFALGSFQIDINKGLAGVNINILNVNTGSETSIIVPYY